MSVVKARALCVLRGGGLKVPNLLFSAVTSAEANRVTAAAAFAAKLFIRSGSYILLCLANDST